MILVTGATGKVGRQAVTQLIDAGEQVRALVRNPETARLPEGVEIARGDLTVPETLHAALEGVEKVFLIWPGFAAETSAEAIDVIKQHAGHVVYLSAHLTEDETMFHTDVERQLAASGLEWTFLQPGGFASNTLGWGAEIRDKGAVSWVFGDAARSLIHEKDIAAVAVHTLTTDGHAGAKYHLSGPEAVTQADQVRILGEAIGVRARWEELPREVAREQTAAMFGDAELAEGAIEAWESFIATPEPVTDTVERLLGRPALTYRQWAADHADDFR